ncbi:MAG: hypothetical protein HZA91_17410 [Verrucomicrobia bacterium]|nr:hypothetical protein [Verrucomicrobiota bacterium]
MRRTFAFVLAVAGAFAVFAPSVVGAPFEEAKLAVPQIQAPPPVKETILKELGTGELDEVRRTKEDGETVYEADITKNEVSRTITVATDGTLLNREMFFNELPAAAQRTVTGLLRGGKVGEVFWGDEGGDHVYWVEVEWPSGKRNYTLALDGTLLAAQVNLEETPEPVQKTIREQLGKNKLSDIDQAGLDTGETRYDVTMLKNNKPRFFSVGPDGALLATQVYLGEMPPAPQKTLRQLVGDRRLALIERWEDEGEVYFEASYISAGIKRTCIVTQAGKLASLETPYAEIPGAVQRTVREKAPGASVLKVEKIFDGPVVYYEVHVRQGGRKLTLEIGEDGKPR